MLTLNDIVDKVEDLGLVVTGNGWVIILVAREEWQLVWEFLIFVGGHD